jgi:hypothetical protein
MNAAETLVRLDEIGASNLVPTMKAAVEFGTCTIPGTPSTLVCNDANPADPRFSIVPRSAAERNMP